MKNMFFVMLVLLLMNVTPTQAQDKHAGREYVLTKGTQCGILKMGMKLFNWDNGKNKKLIEERNVSFEEVVLYIEKGHLLDKIEHPDQNKYKGQKIFIVQIDEYAYLVPFVENEKEVFLKTIIPSRKATKTYLKER